ncbi:MAG: zf-HC2 domain-containing protein [Clostridiales bacterium]|nr:zf-HC2 domain-containing protein [Clostridiales bacterium]
MKYQCEIVRDLMPLYLDGVASEQSRQMVDGHLGECKECSALFSRMQNNELEIEVKKEKTDVIARQRKFFKRKSALVGSVFAGIFMIPVIVCLIVNLASGAGLTWFFIVLASLLVAASLTAVPLMVPENKFLWSLGTFALSLTLLLGVCCLYTGGRWFFVASLSSLFGLGMVFLPFAVQSRALSGFLKKQKALAVMTADTVLYVLMMLGIGLYTAAPDFFRVSAAISLPLIGFAWAIFALIRYAGKNGWVKAGLCSALGGGFVFSADALINRLLGWSVRLPEFSPFQWNAVTVDGNVKWLALILGALLGVIFIAAGLIGRRKKR